MVWMRADGDLPDDPVLHACIVTYASDLTLLDTALRPFGMSAFNDNLMMASLDHAMWFHRPFRADEWLLYEQTAISAHRRVDSQVARSSPSTVSSSSMWCRRA